MKHFSDYLDKVTEWWNDEEQVKALINTNLLNRNTWNLLQKLIPLMNEEYGDKWDLRIRFDYDDDELFAHRNLVSYIYFIIHFPEVEITNSRKEFHTIHDLFVRFCIARIINGSDEIEIESIEGVKLTYDYAEFMQSYTHSHLSAKGVSDAPEFDNFCLGTGSIKMIMMALNSAFYSSDFDTNLFRMFLYELRVYVGWESIEGGPYSQIAKIKAIVNNGNLSPLGQDRIKRYIQNLERLSYYLKSSVKNINIDIDQDGNLCVVDDEMFELLLKNTHVNSNYMCFKDENGNYYDDNYVPEYINEEINPEPLIFKGKEYRYKVDMELPYGKPEKYLHPTAKNLFKKMLEYELNKEATKFIAFG